MANAQSSNDGLLLLDKSTQPSCETLLSQLDSFSAELFRAPNSKGYLVIFGGQNPVLNDYYKRFTRFYLKKNRGLKKYELVTTGSTDQLSLEFWIGKNGTRPKVEPKKLGLIIPKHLDRIQYTWEGLQLVKKDRVWTYLVFAKDDCSIDYFQPSQLEKFLEATPDVKAHIEIYSDSRKTARKLKSILRKKFLSKSRILKLRTTIAHEGRLKLNKCERDESKSWKFCLSRAEIEIWLVRSKPPNLKIK